MDIFEIFAFKNHATRHHLSSGTFTRTICLSLHLFNLMNIDQMEKDE